MIVTQQPWDYAIDLTSTPYKLDSVAGGPSVSGGLLVLQHPSAHCAVVNATSVDPTGWVTPGRATYFELDPTNAVGSIFLARFGTPYDPYYSEYTFYPAIQSLGGGQLVLGWVRSDCVTETDAPAFALQASSSIPEWDGDFTLNSIPVEAGTVRVQIIRDMAYRTTQMQVLMPSGTVYTTGLFDYTYDLEVISIDVSPYNTGSSGYFTVGPITDVSNLTSGEVQAFRAAGPISDVPTPIIFPYPDEYANSGSSNITITTLSASTAGYTLRYTLNGSDPTAASTAYTAAIAVESLFNPGATTVVKAAYVNNSTSDVGRIVSSSYTWAVSAPQPDGIICYDGMSSTVDAPILWATAPVVSSLQIVYTLDGSDPTTSGTAQVWIPGAKYPFNSHPVSTTPAPYQANTLMAATRYTPTGDYSAVTTLSVYFLLGPVVITPPDGAQTDSINGAVMFSNPANVHAGLVYSVTKDGVLTTSTTPPTFYFPYGPGAAHTLSASVSTADGSLIVNAVVSGTSNRLLATYSFYQAAPVFPSPNPITSTSVAVEVLNPNGSSSSLHYTLDGSTPTIASPALIGNFITASSGNIIRAISARDGVVSGITSTTVLNEYEVTEAATTIEGAVSYHYYVASQRLALTSQLGPGADIVTVGTNTTPTRVNATINGTAASLSLWDRTNPAGAFNGFSEFVWLAVPTRFWSRLAYSEVTSTFSWIYTAPLFSNAPTVPLFEFYVVSRYYSVKFRYTLTPSTGATSITRTLTTFGGSTSATATTAGATLVDGTTYNMSIAVGANTVSFSDGVGTSTETNAAFSSGALWSIEGVVNPSSVSNSYSNSGYQYTKSVAMGIACTVTTVATSGRLRRAPGSLSCTRGSVSRTETKSLDFQDDQAQHLVRHGRYTHSSTDNMVYESPATFGYNPKKGVTQVDGPFALSFPGVINAGQNFVAEVDLTTDFHAIMTNPSQCIGVTTLPSIALYLEAEDAVLNERTTASAGGIVCRMFVPSGASGAAAVHLELYAEGSTPVSSRVALSSSTRRLHLRLTNAGSGLAVSAIIDGVETVVATLPAVTGNHLVRLRRWGSTYQPRIQTTELVAYTVTATFVKPTATNPVIAGANFVYHGVASGFPATPITVAANTVKAVYFNATTNLITVEDLAYEATGGRLLVGVIDTHDDNVLWTNLLYSRLLKVRQESEGTPTTGAVLAVGSNIRVQDHRIYWKEAGIERSAAVGDFSWHMPYNRHDFRLGKQVVRALEYQTIKLTGSKVA